MKSTRLFSWGALGLVGTAVATVLACGGGGFDPQSAVDSVRIFATAADKPYAKPGDQVTLTILTTDARKTKTRPLKNFWIPLVCMNPTSDLYYLCFVPKGTASGSGLADAGATLIPVGPLADAGAAVDAGAGTGPGAGPATNPFGSIPSGVDLSPFLPQGDSFSFQMPADAIQPRKGVAPYGLAVVFNVACAGQVRLLQRDLSGGPQQVPIACTDESGVPLPPSDYVIGISRVYAYDTRTNTNPVIEKVTLEGVDVDPKAGITIDHCTEQLRANCKENKLGIRVSDASWELNPTESNPDEVLHEQIWADYYSDQGQMADEAKLLFDTSKGRIEPNDEKFYAPNDAREGSIWVVVHDNRGGASWTVLPLHVK